MVGYPFCLSRSTLLFWISYACIWGDAVAPHKWNALGLSPFACPNFETVSDMASMYNCTIPIKKFTFFHCLWDICLSSYFQRRVFTIDILYDEEEELVAGCTDATLTLTWSMGRRKESISQFRLRRMFPPVWFDCIHCWLSCPTASPYMLVTVGSFHLLQNSCVQLFFPNCSQQSDD